MIVGLKQIAHMCLSCSVCAWPINGYIFSFFFPPFFKKGGGGVYTNLYVDITYKFQQSTVLKMKSKD
jgi:hypothetical protein